jgi:hypothetical protein
MTVESTSGWGINSLLETWKSSLTVAKVFTFTVRTPYSLVPADAVSLSAYSFYTMSNALEKRGPSNMILSIIGEVM